MYSLVTFALVVAVAQAGMMSFPTGFQSYAPQLVMEQQPFYRSYAQSYAPLYVPQQQQMQAVVVQTPQQVISVQPPPRYVYGPQQTIVQQPPPRYVHIETPPRIVEVERPVIQTVRQNVYVPVDRHITQTYVRPVYRHVTVQQAPLPQRVQFVEAPQQTYTAPIAHDVPVPVHQLEVQQPIATVASGYATAWKKA